MQKIVILGASGHGGVVLDCILKEGIYDCIGFLDSYKSSGSSYLGYEILGNENDLPAIMDKYKVSGIVIAIGDNHTRKCVVQKIRKLVPDLEFVSTVHPSAIVSREVVMGAGSVLLSGVKITSNSFVGDHCILNTNSILEHDSVMHNYSSLAPMVCVGGGFQLGECSAMCIGVICIENITVGDHSVVGAGALVLSDIPNSVLAIGRPARIIRNRKAGEPYLGSRHKELVIPILKSEI